MKGLIQKDIFVIKKQMKIFLVMIICFAVVPTSNMSCFAAVYAAMLPYSTMAYDERSRWDQMALMMPYSFRDLVLSKYILGWALSGATSLLVVLVGFTGLGGAEPLNGVVSFIVSWMFLAIMLPLLFRFGVEKGRMMYLTVFAIMFAGIVGAAFLIQRSGAELHTETAASNALILAVLVLVVLAANAVSVPLSIRLYRKRCFA